MTTQRPFAWEPSKVRILLDSHYQGFPVAYLIAWRNPAALFLVERRRLMADKIRQWLDIL